MPKSTISKKTAQRKVHKKIIHANEINTASVRMYCMGTGDCFIVKFGNDESDVFTMMIDCGSCSGGPKEFEPYVKNLADYVNKKIDLLIVTHEHNDHVNGFAKCASIFKQFEIKEAWFGWTENTEDPNGYAQKLKNKQGKMKLALNNAICEIKKRNKTLEKSNLDSYQKNIFLKSSEALMNGLDTLELINVSDGDKKGEELPGMLAIKKILKDKKVKIRYLNPGDIITIPGIPSLKFYILGPPTDRNYIFKDGKLGADVYKKNFELYNSSLAAEAFLNLSKDSLNYKDLPFASYYLVEQNDREVRSQINSYKGPKNEWRKIDNNWLNNAGSLELRINSHINNTSLAFAVEFDKTKEVMLFPGDAEYGSWESWHNIEKWKNKGKDGKHLVEDLLNRTIFYKVGHHLSYNGTALEKGISMMTNSELFSMATLDRNRIAKNWKSTMPNKYLLQELIQKCDGKLIIMDEFEIKNGPSEILDPKTLGENIYETDQFNNGNTIYKQYNLHINQ